MNSWHSICKTTKVGIPWLPSNSTLGRLHHSHGDGGASAGCARAAVRGKSHGLAWHGWTGAKTCITRSEDFEEFDAWMHHRVYRILVGRRWPWLKPPHICDGVRWEWRFASARAGSQSIWTIHWRGTDTKLVAADAERVGICASEGYHSSRFEGNEHFSERHMANMQAGWLWHFNCRGNWQIGIWLCGHSCIYGTRTSLESKICICSGSVGYWRGALRIDGIEVAVCWLQRAISCVPDCIQQLWWCSAGDGWLFACIDWTCGKISWQRSDQAARCSSLASRGHSMGDFFVRSCQLICHHVLQPEHVTVTVFLQWTGSDGSGSPPRCQRNARHQCWTDQISWAGSISIAR